MSAQKPHPDSGAYWAMELRAVGADAVEEIAAQLAQFQDIESLGTNVLSGISELLARAVRRRLLRKALAQTDWSPVKAARLLRMSSGPSQITKMVRDLDLLDEYAAGRAKSASAKARGGRPRTTP